MALEFRCLGSLAFAHVPQLSAQSLGHDDVVRLLTTNLNEEKAANTKLTIIALRKGVNDKASAA
jgi:ferritin-like metal-binding protein YciE